MLSSWFMLGPLLDMSFNSLVFVSFPSMFDLECKAPPRVQVLQHTTSEEFEEGPGPILSREPSHALSRQVSVAKREAKPVCLPVILSMKAKNTKANRTFLSDLPPTPPRRRNPRLKGNSWKLDDVRPKLESQATSSINCKDR